MFRHEVPEERIVSLETDLGAEVFTGGHRIYVNPTDRVPAEELRPGDLVLAVHVEQPLYLPVKAVRPLPPRRYMYDLTAEDYHNFVSGPEASSGTVKSNSPDRNYHFRPPESEANIGAYNRVFGQIWEDKELVEFLERGLDWWNMMPPATEDLNNIDVLVRDKPAWRTAILWQAIVHACFALQANWTAEEFSIVGEESVSVWTRGGIEHPVPIAWLYEALHGDPTSRPGAPTPGLPDFYLIEKATYLREEWLKGALLARTADPETGLMHYHPVKDVMRHATGHKPLARVTLEDGRTVTCTEDHSLFVMAEGGGGDLIRPARAVELRPGVSRLATVDRGGVLGVKVASVVMLPPALYTYDLCVPGPENFSLSNGILAHNSYSIGGISLDIQRSSSYQSLADSASQQFDKAAEAKARTVKWIRGIQQPRFGMGVRSSFGPHVGRGVLSPRGFM